MNYNLLHDSIINRARIREYDSNVHHKHHIIPRHEDPLSEETVPLTIKEHYIIHLLRWKITGTLGNKLAYSFMRGIGTIQTQKEMASLGGKKGGKITKESNKGIFDPSYDRGKQSKDNWKNGVFDHINFCEINKEKGKITN